MFNSRCLYVKYFFTKVKRAFAVWYNGYRRKEAVFVFFRLSVLLIYFKEVKGAVYVC